MAIMELSATTAERVEISKWSPDTEDNATTSDSTSLQESFDDNEMLEEQAVLMEFAPVEMCSPVVENLEQEFDHEEFLAAEIFRDVPEVKLPFEAGEESGEDEGPPRLYDNPWNFRMWLAALPSGTYDEAWDAKNPYRLLKKAAFREALTLTDDEILRQYEDPVVSQTILPTSDGATLDMAARLKSLRFNSVGRHHHKESMLKKFPILGKMYSQSNAVEYACVTNFGVHDTFVMKQTTIDANEYANLKKPKIKQMTLLSSRSEINIRSYLTRQLVGMRPSNDRTRNNIFGNRLLKETVPVSRSTLSDLVAASNDAVVTDQAILRRNEQRNLLNAKIRRMNLHSPKNRNKACLQNSTNFAESLAEPPGYPSTSLLANDECLHTTFETFNNSRSASLPAAAGDSFALGNYELTPSIGEHEAPHILEYDISDWHDFDSSGAQNETKVAFEEANQHEMPDANVNGIVDNGNEERQIEQLKRIKLARRRFHVDIEEPQGINYSHDEAC